MSSAGSASEHFDLLFVCTGNLCRSPLAERLARAWLDEALGARAASVRLTSAGTRAVDGSSMHPDSALVLTGLGGDPAAFRSRRLTPEIAGSADLILTMTRRHREEVLRLAPRALSRTYTLREAAELVRDVEDLAGRSVPERARDLVGRLADARARRPGSSDAHDVVDPIGRPLPVHAEVGDVIAAALLPVLRPVVHGSGSL